MDGWDFEDTSWMWGGHDDPIFPDDTMTMPPVTTTTPPPGDDGFDTLYLTYYYYGILPGDVLLPVSYGGGDAGSGDGGDDGNHCEASFADGLKDSFAIAVKNSINDQLSSQWAEWGAVIMLPSGGFPSLFQGMISSDGQPLSTTLLIPAGSDIGDARATIHNHPFDGFSSDADRRLNRYPSTADWDAAQAYVDAGANPDTFSVYIIDPWGVVREFDFADRTKWESLTEREKQNGKDLPADLESTPASDC